MMEAEPELPPNAVVETSKLNIDSVDGALENEPDASIEIDGKNSNDDGDFLCQTPIGSPGGQDDEQAQLASNLKSLSTADDVNLQLEDSVNCFVRCEFKDSETFNQLHGIIGQCIRDALFSLKKSTNVVVDDTQNVLKVFEIAGDYADDSMFMVDTLPTDCMNESEIPNYDAMDSDILDHNVINIEPDTIQQQSENKATGNCWNCGGNHCLKDCKEPHNPVNVSRNKQLFMQKNRTERYHLESDQRFGHFEPGTISDDLRDALGLRSRELPLYIYKMRLYGYPPGWFEDAKIAQSGISLLDANADIELKETDTDDIAPQIPIVKFDASKFIEYPGFNAPLPANMIDDSGYYQIPPMQYAHTIKGLSIMLQDNLVSSYKRKRFKCNSLDNTTQNELRNDNMELACSDHEGTIIFANSLIEETMPDNNAANNCDDSTDSTDDSASKSNDSTSLLSKSSLIELKRKKEELLKALADDNTLDQDSNSTADNDSSCVKDAGANVSGQHVVETQQNAELNETLPDLAKIVNPVTPKMPKVNGRLRETVNGTPLIQQISPFSNLPSSDKWSIGVSDVIDFENLPDAVGTYRKMSEIIQKVRVHAGKISDDSDPESCQHEANTSL